jgi:dTDP-4-dehydrorhamnose 3,5-epimerase-like enzyme
MDKVAIEQLPETKDAEGAKRWDEERGEFVQVSYREDIGHVVFFQIKDGFSRGSHYHALKEEAFYVVKGKIRAIFMDMETRTKEEYVLTKGRKIRVQPNCAHIFHGLEESLIIEYSPQYYDKGDTYPIDFGQFPDRV